MIFLFCEFFSTSEFSLRYQENGIDAACGRSAAPRNVTLSHIFVLKRLLRFMTCANNWTFCRVLKSGFYEAQQCSKRKPERISEILESWIPVASFSIFWWVAFLYRVEFELFVRRSTSAKNSSVVAEFQDELRAAFLNYSTPATSYNNAPKDYIQQKLALLYF